MTSQTGTVVSVQVGSNNRMLRRLAVKMDNGHNLFVWWNLKWTCTREPRKHDRVRVDRRAMGGPRLLGVWSSEDECADSTVWARVDRVGPYAQGRVAKLYLNTPAGVSVVSTWNVESRLPCPANGDLVRIRLSGRYKYNDLLAVAQLTPIDNGLNVSISGDYRKRPDENGMLAQWGLFQPENGDELTVTFSASRALLATIHYGGRQAESNGTVIFKQQQKEDDMAMSKDRVKFRLPEGILTNQKMPDVLERAFGLTADEVRELRQKQCGATIVCRPSQFARFMIYRNEAGIPNLFQVLQAKLIDADEIEQREPHVWAAEQAGVPPAHACAVVDALGIGPDYIRERMREVGALPNVVDVSKNPHTG